ncbi:hypothetical protein BS50DRAFT_623869 [Corynespora cassiicola Philippines]|uniref:Uncharacterized protein n=1 Tax=Corynespora cassiicola Philippines TaxID=1448308 RepID=A0A2T2NC40_CORCC|nr:hypothetical protein BS50DRAFT_623869 [Corynespora cassiicola Philippines]
MRRRRPSPIQIPSESFDDRESKESSTGGDTPKTEASPQIILPPTQTPSPTQIPSPTRNPFTSRIPSSSPTRASFLSAVPTSKPSTTSISSAKQSASPTKTSFVTVTQTLRPLAEGQETPEADHTVFITLSQQPTSSLAPTEIASTGTATPQETGQGVAQAGTIKKNSLSPLAIRFLVALGVIAGVALLLGGSIILWRRRKTKNKRREQPDMTEGEENGFRAIDDTEPVLRRSN